MTKMFIPRRPNRSVHTDDEEEDHDWWTRVNL